jgi:hypothetical protein
MLALDHWSRARAFARAFPEHDEADASADDEGSDSEDKQELWDFHNKLKVSLRNKESNQGHRATHKPKIKFDSTLGYPGEGPGDWHSRLSHTMGTPCGGVCGILDCDYVYLAVYYLDLDAESYSHANLHAAMVHADYSFGPASWRVFRGLGVSIFNYTRRWRYVREAYVNYYTSGGVAPFGIEDILDYMVLLTSMPRSRDVPARLFDSTRGYPGEGPGADKSVCFDFQKGKCQRGEKCKFAHVLSSKPPSPCFDFQKGKCARGEKCRFAHVAPNKPHKSKVQLPPLPPPQPAQRAAALAPTVWKPLPVNMLGWEDSWLAPVQPIAGLPAITPAVRVDDNIAVVTDMPIEDGDGPPSTVKEEVKEHARLAADVTLDDVYQWHRDHGTETPFPKHWYAVEAGKQPKKRRENLKACRACGSQEHLYKECPTRFKGPSGNFVDPDGPGPDPGDGGDDEPEPEPEPVDPKIEAQAKLTKAINLLDDYIMAQCRLMTHWRPVDLGIFKQAVYRYADKEQIFSLYAQLDYGLATIYIDQRIATLRRRDVFAERASLHTVAQSHPDDPALNTHFPDWFREDAKTMEIDVKDDDPHVCAFAEGLRLAPPAGGWALRRKLRWVTPCEQVAILREVPVASIRPNPPSMDSSLSWTNLAGRITRAVGSAVAEESGKAIAAKAAFLGMHMLLPIVAWPALFAAGAAATAASAYIAYQETHLTPQTLVRAAAQTALWTGGLVAAIPLHAAWNLTCVAASRDDLQLSILAEHNNMTTDPVLTDYCLDCDVQCAVMQEKATVTWGENHCRPRFGCRAIIRFGEVSQRVDRNCSHNEKIGLTQRVLKQLPMHEEGRDKDVRRHWRAARDHFLSRYKFRKVRRMETQAWLDRYTGAKKRIFVGLLRNYQPWRNKYCKSFIKRQKSRQNIYRTTKVAAPRIIQGADPKETVIAGPYLVPLAKHLQDVLSPSNGGKIVYTSGMNGEQVGQALKDAIDSIRLEDPTDRIVFIEDDQSRFDLHMTKGAFDSVDAWYAQTLPERVRKLLKRNVSTGVIGRGTWYSVPYGMQSGKVDTAVADTQANSVMKTYIYETTPNYTTSSWERNNDPVIQYITLVCGDDSVTVTTQRQFERWGGVAGLTKEYEKFGMEVTIDVRYDVLDVQYCSGRFLPITERGNSSFLFVPKIGKLIGGLFWDDVDRSPVNRLAWCRGTLPLLARLGRYDPVARAIAKRVASLCGPGPVIKHPESEYKSVVAGVYDNARCDTGLYYHTHYGLYPSSMKMLIEEIESITFGWNKQPLLSDLCARDL